jgi:hypothetical protein
MPVHVAAEPYVWIPDSAELDTVWRFANYDFPEKVNAIAFGQRSLDEAPDLPAALTAHGFTEEKRHGELRLYLRHAP